MGPKRENLNKMLTISLLPNLIFCFSWIYRAWIASIEESRKLVSWVLAKYGECAELREASLVLKDRRHAHEFANGSYQCKPNSLKESSDLKESSLIIPEIYEIAARRI
jgi:hypothetical protein